MGNISIALENARRELIDVGFRNSLLHYRVLKAKGVEIVDELPDQVYATIVANSRAMSFLPVPDALVEAAADSDSGERDLLFELLQEELSSGDDEGTDGLAARHADTKLQTPYAKARLERRLLNTFYAARSSIEEQGVNTLYIALGMLRWREAEHSGTERVSPLILVPVELRRSDVRGTFRVAFTGDEVGHNLSLEAKLKADFGLSIPPIDHSEDLKPSDYFAAVANAVCHQKGWTVDDGTVALGFFSFAKFLMYKDLDSANWPEDAILTDHEVIEALLGNGFEDAPWDDGEAASIDNILDPRDIFHIRDADSSQTTAILRAHAGHNLVIQGPPGTGKSQTISNLIAEGIVRGKKILFVSEKMAALEVVKRRLDDDGIGVACLELHSNKTNKKNFLKDLEDTLGLGAPREGARGSSADELRVARDRLNEYCRAVNEPLTADRQSAPIRVFGHLSRLEKALANVSHPTLDGLAAADWSWRDVQNHIGLLRDFESAIRTLGNPLEHAFGGARAKVVLPSDYSVIRERAGEVSEALRRLRDYVNKVSDSIDLPEPNDLAQVSGIRRSLELLINKPRLGDLDLESDLWKQRATELHQLIEKGRCFDKLRKQHDNTLAPGAWDADVCEARRTLRDNRGRWWRFVVPAGWRARKYTRTLCRESVPRQLSEQIKLLDAISEARNLAAELNAGADLLEGVLRKSWKEEHTQWRFVAPSGLWCLDVHEALMENAVPREFLDVVRREHDTAAFRKHLKRLDELQQTFAKSHEDALQVAAFDASADDDGDFGRIERRFIAWAQNPESIQDVTRYNHLAAQITERGLEAFIPLSTTWEGANRLLAEALQYTWFNVLAERAYEERPVLAGFEGRSHETVVRRFQELDDDLLRMNRAAVARAHWEGLPGRNAAGQMGVLLREFSKRRRHLPIRKVMAEAGMAVQAIKPVLMMSPLSVATYIPPGSVQFDMVIFDEASQVRPVEALGAIARSEQAVVVGDSRQLPPTTFFENIVEFDDEDNEDTPVTGDMESVLGLFTAQGAPTEMLRWHYRSKHESLITVSNYEFYEGKLVTFPTPVPPDGNLGVTLQYLPHTNYERGSRKACNRGEAAAVAAAVMRHAHETPNLTLGVAAFSKSQAQALLDHVEMARRKDPTLESFFASHPEEPFFVKNLENVQGDERDVILISIGYGKDESGYLAQNFGPLNRDGGERRLNVLVTRARRRCEVFTNFQSGDIDLSRSQGLGVAALKRYLSFAETGNLDLPVATGGDAESPFEEGVAAALDSLGHSYVHQVGSGGFRIDLAVRDPEQPGRFVLGIECDGASYHSARWARDRDRIRQEVLEGLGWRIHRIWSTDWFRNPERELRRLDGAIQEALVALPAALPARGVQTSEGSGSPEGCHIERDESETLCASLTSEPYHIAELGFLQFGERELHEVSAEEMATWVVKVVETESPVHYIEAARRITEAAGFQRTGRRIVAAVRRGIKHAERKAWIRTEGDFLWCEGTGVKPRDRSQLPQQSRKIELIAPEEVVAALVLVVDASVGIERSEAIRSAAGLLGYSRTAEHISGGIRSVLEDAIEAGELVESGDFLRTP